MIKTVQFKLEHLATLTPQPEQRAEWQLALENGLAGAGWTVLVDDKAVACATLVGAGARGAVFAFIGADAGPHLLAVYRAAERMLDMTAYSRIEATTPTGFVAGDRWLRMLDFELETPKGMRGFGVNGETHSLYARIR